MVMIVMIVMKSWRKKDGEEALNQDEERGEGG